MHRKTLLRGPSLEPSLHLKPTPSTESYTIFRKIYKSAQNVRLHAAPRLAAYCSFLDMKCRDPVDNRFVSFGYSNGIPHLTRNFGREYVCDGVGANIQNQGDQISDVFRTFIGALLPGCASANPDLALPPPHSRRRLVTSSRLIR